MCGLYCIVPSKTSYQTNLRKTRSHCSRILSGLRKSRQRRKDFAIKCPNKSNGIFTECSLLIHRSKLSPNYHVTDQKTFCRQMRNPMNLNGRLVTCLLVAVLAMSVKANAGVLFQYTFDSVTGQGPYSPSTTATGISSTATLGFSLEAIDTTPAGDELVVKVGTFSGSYSNNSSIDFSLNNNTGSSLSLNRFTFDIRSLGGSGQLGYYRVLSSEDFSVGTKTVTTLETNSAFSPQNTLNVDIALTGQSFSTLADQSTIFFRIIMQNQGSSIRHSLDNVTITNVDQGVPEPTGLAIFIGLTMAAARRTRKSRSRA